LIVLWPRGVSFQISFFLSSYIVPLTLISILYVGMLIRLWHSAPGSKVSAESRRGKKRVTRMVVFVVLGENMKNSTQYQR
jgi:allatostatin A receptor